MKTIQQIISEVGVSNIVAAFHHIWYNSPDTWPKNTFLGKKILQNPMDLQIYQEIIHKRRPNFILQTGVEGGGSILYFAKMLDIIEADPSCKVIGVDINLQDEAKVIYHPRVILLQGSSTDPKTIERIDEIVGNNKGMVILDSDHRGAHVASELQMYNKYVASGQFLVVEDTNINGHPVAPGFGYGPMEAVIDFLKSHTEFVNDKLWRRNMFSFHPDGWLLRK